MKITQHNNNLNDEYEGKEKLDAVDKADEIYVLQILQCLVYPKIYIKQT